MKSTKDLLREGFASIPNDFAYREIRFHVYHALQKLETLEKRALTKEKQKQESKIKEEEKRKSQSWQPPIYQNAFAVQQTLDILDKMIAEEMKIIENVRNKKGQVNKNEHPYEDDEQTLHG
jgi:hypothetical protein